VFLSTSEITLDAKLCEAGQHTRAGQDVRLIGLPADAARGWASGKIFMVSLLPRRSPTICGQLPRRAVARQG
jgi:hypothetical protein